MAVRGLDPSEAHFFDRWWWLKVKLITDWLEREAFARVFEMQHRMHCAAMLLKDAKPQESWENATSMVNKVINNLLPWVPVQSKDDMRRQIVDNWKRMYGDPRDPDVAERIRQTALALIRDANDAIRRSQTGR